MEPKLAAALAPRVQRLAYLGEFFRCMGHQPEALLGFIAFTESAKSGLDKRLVELLALTVASIKGNAYERNQHERLSVRSGFGRDWVREVEALAPESSELLSVLERQVQRFTIDTVESDGHGARRQLDALVAALGHERAVAILMVIARYTTHALLVASLDLAPPVPSIFEDGFAGD